MSSTLTDRPEAISLTTAERLALIGYAVRRLDEYENPIGLEGDAASLRTAAEAFGRAANLTAAAIAGALPSVLVETARTGLDRAIEDARDHAAYEKRCQDRWRAGDRDCGWPDNSDEESDAALAEQVANAEYRVAALESLAAKLGGAA